MQLYVGHAGADALFASALFGAEKRRPAFRARRSARSIRRSAPHPPVDAADALPNVEHLLWSASRAGAVSCKAAAMSAHAIATAIATAAPVG